MERGMPKDSLEELKGQIAAGQYAIDPGILAGDILSKVALIKRVRRMLVREDDQAAGPEERGAPARRHRGLALAAWRAAQARGDRSS
jgi:hypothetical protein